MALGKTMKANFLAGAGLMVVALLSARAADTAGSPETLRAEIDSLKAAKVAWREIGWKSCLLEGLRESRLRNKPALLWVFIDRPVDDARC
jgi:hypothetical protein